MKIKVFNQVGEFVVKELTSESVVYYRQGDSGIVSRMSRVDEGHGWSIVEYDEPHGWETLPPKDKEPELVPELVPEEVVEDVPEEDKPNEETSDTTLSETQE